MLHGGLSRDELSSALNDCVHGDGRPIGEAAVACVTVDMANDDLDEAWRVTSARLLGTGADTNALALLEATGPWIARTRLRRTRVRLGRRAIAIIRVDHEDGSGR